MALPTTMFRKMKNVVGPRIREARRRSGRKVTQQELVARLQTIGLEIDRTAISKIEAGTRPVTDVEIVAICKALGVKVATLFPDDEETRSGLASADP
ncbi:MAG: helix-turn-helix transcriptional regulator [Chloroflexota bacterium]|nr:helix-turn-helix transcriptional regulator [Chloroflexota bacterium]